MASTNDGVRHAEKELLRQKSLSVLNDFKEITTSQTSTPRSHTRANSSLHWRYGRNQTTNLQPTNLSLKAFVVLVWYLTLKELQTLADDVATLRAAGEYIDNHEKFPRLPKWWVALYEGWVKERALAIKFRGECFRTLEVQDAEDPLDAEDPQEEDEPAYIITIAPRAQLDEFFADDVLRSMQQTPSWNVGHPVVFNVQGHFFSNKIRYQLEVSENKSFTEKEVFRDTTWGRITGIQRRNFLCIECDGKDQNVISNKIFGGPST